MLFVSKKSYEKLLDKHGELTGKYMEILRKYVDLQKENNLLRKQLIERK